MRTYQLIFDIVLSAIMFHFFNYVFNLEIEVAFIINIVSMCKKT